MVAQEPGNWRTVYEVHKYLKEGKQAMSVHEKPFVVEGFEEEFRVPEEFMEEPHFKVYLASALTGREKERACDDEVRLAIVDAFEKAICLKVPYKIGYKVYDPAKHTAPGSPHSACEVYATDFRKIVESDIALFYVNAPSLGVGIERQIAASGCVIAGVVRSSDQRMSRMFDGVLGGSLFNVGFSSLDDLKAKLSHQLASAGPRLLEIARRRRRVLGDWRAKGMLMTKLIFQARVSSGMGIGELAENTGIDRSWWMQLERDDTGVMAGVTWTPVLIGTLCEVLELKYVIEAGGLPKIKWGAKVSGHKKQSLDSLYEAVVSRERITDDQIVLDMWNEYNTETQPSGMPLLEGSNIISSDQWTKRFREAEKRELMIKLKVKGLSGIESKSFESLCEFSGRANGAIAVEILVKLWGDYRGHLRAGKAAARRGAAKPKHYTVGDWQRAFNGLQLGE